MLWTYICTWKIFDQKVHFWTLQFEVAKKWRKHSRLKSIFLSKNIWTPVLKLFAGSATNDTKWYKKIQKDTFFLYHCIISKDTRIQAIFPDDTKIQYKCIVSYCIVCIIGIPGRLQIRIDTTSVPKVYQKCTRKVTFFVPEMCQPWWFSLAFKLCFCTRSVPEISANEMIYWLFIIFWYTSGTFLV